MLKLQRYQAADASLAVIAARYARRTGLSRQPCLLTMPGTTDTIRQQVIGVHDVQLGGAKSSEAFGFGDRHLRQGQNWHRIVQAPESEKRSDNFQDVGGQGGP